MTTMKSRHQREVGELKEQLHRANLASERDQALREKVFNEAKAEVMALSKKVLTFVLFVFSYLFVFACYSFWGCSEKRHCRSTAVAVA